MIITNLDNPLTAEDARKISLSNRDDSVDRIRFREIMQQIKECASFGYTRYQSEARVTNQNPSEHVCNALSSMGYKVIVKRAYQWDEERKGWSDRPSLSAHGREQFFLEITWG